MPAIPLRIRKKLPKKNWKPNLKLFKNKLEVPTTNELDISTVAHGSET